MNIFQKKIAKQSNLFKIYNSWFWNENDIMPFRKARNLIRLWNKEERADSIELINKEIESIKNSMEELRIERN